MPAYNHNHSRRDFLTIPADAGSTTTFDKNNTSPVTPAVTGIVYPSPVDASTEAGSSRYRVARRFYTHPNIAESAIDDVPEPLTEGSSLDQLWETLRQKKERKMAKERSKVQSLEEATNELSLEPPAVEIRLESQASPPRPLRRQKSIASFRESTDGRSIVATFDLRDIPKEDIHVSFQRNRIIVTWRTEEFQEWEDEDGLITKVRNFESFHRTLPLPEGTKFHEIHGQMLGHGSLIIRYPNMRCLRVEPSSRSGES